MFHKECDCWLNCVPTNVLKTKNVTETISFWRNKNDVNKTEYKKKIIECFLFRQTIEILVLLLDALMQTSTTVSLDVIL